MNNDKKTTGATWINVFEEYVECQKELLKQVKNIAEMKKAHFERMKARNNPFFDEQKKDWEILTGENQNSGYIHDWVDAETQTGYFCHQNKCKIHSVKRTSDGEILTIGDLTKGSGDNKPERITKFNVSGVGEMLVTGEHYMKDIKWVEKVKERPVLFVTEDGVDIYEGHQYFYVSTDWYVGVFNAYYNSEKIAYKTFSTKEAAENYVVLNKPCLSVNDVLGQIYSPDSKTLWNLKELAKQKMAV